MTNPKKNKAVKAASFFASEVSGLTFLKRGISSHINLFIDTKEFAENNLDAAKDNVNIEKQTPLNEIPEHIKQIKQANSLFSGLVYLLCFFMSLVYLLTTVFTSDDYISLFIRDNKFIFLSSIAVGLISMVFFFLQATIALKDFLKIYNSTPTPIGLVNEYKYSLSLLCLIFITHNFFVTLMQISPDLSGLKLITGFFSLSTIIALYRSTRRIYDPTLKASNTKNSLFVFLQTIIGLSQSRNVTGNYAKYDPAVYIGTSSCFFFATILTKEIGIVGVISLFISSISFAAILAMYIYGWRLKHD